MSETLHSTVKDKLATGGLASRPDLVAEFVKMGARYVLTGTDLNFLLAAA